MGKYARIVFPAILLLAGYLLYRPALVNGFVNWDDDVLVLDNDDIRNLDAESLEAFFTEYYVGHYHPLTMLSYALDYQAGEYDAGVYHSHNLLLHLLNCIIVFFIAYLLLNSYFASFLVALLFLSHPMRVESVAWIAERKDVLFSFYYLMAILTYLLHFVRKRKGLLLALTGLFFSMSLLAKMSAVSLPLVLLAIDYYKNGNIKARMILKLAPFFLVSIIAGLFTLYVLKETGSVHDAGYDYSFADKIVMPFYATAFYLMKVIYPFGLSPAYFFEPKDGGFLPLLYYIAPLLVAAIIALIFKIKKYRKDLIFAFWIFLATLALFLQVVPSGRVLMADRYTYLPFLGIFFLIGRVYVILKEKRLKKAEYAFYFICAILITVYSVSTTMRISIWRSGESLFTEMIIKNPGNTLGYVNRGIAKYYGFTRSNMANLPGAVEDFNAALKLDPNEKNALFNRGNSLYMLGDFKNAYSDFDAVIKLDSAYAKAWNNRGLILSRFYKDSLAIADFNMALELNSEYAEARLNRGISWHNISQNDKACSDWRRAADQGNQRAAQLLSQYCNKTGR